MFVHSHTMFWIGVAGIHDELELWPTLLLCGRASNTGGQPIAIGVASAGNAGAGDADCQDLRRISHLLYSLGDLTANGPTWLPG